MSQVFFCVLIYCYHICMASLLPSPHVLRLPHNRPIKPRDEVLYHMPRSAHFREAWFASHIGCLWFPLGCTCCWFWVRCYPREIGSPACTISLWCLFVCLFVLENWSGECSLGQLGEVGAMGGFLTHFTLLNAPSLLLSSPGLIPISPRAAQSPTLEDQVNYGGVVRTPSSEHKGRKNSTLRCKDLWGRKTCVGKGN